MNYRYRTAKNTHGSRCLFWRQQAEPFGSSGTAWRRSGPVGYGSTNEEAMEDWRRRMMSAGLPFDPTPTPVVPGSPVTNLYPGTVEAREFDNSPMQKALKTIYAERRQKFYIVRGGDTFQPCNDERFEGTDIAPFQTSTAAIEAAVKGATTEQGMKCVYEVRLVGTALPQDAYFKPAKVPATRAKRKAARKPK